MGNSNNDNNAVAPPPSAEVFEGEDVPAIVGGGEKPATSHDAPQEEIELITGEVKAKMRAMEGNEQTPTDGKNGESEDHKAEDDTGEDPQEENVGIPTASSSKGGSTSVKQDPPAPVTPGKAAVVAEMESIEDEVGYLCGEYPCAHNHIQGKLYAGSEGFTFKGTVFFYKCHFNVKWKHVKRVAPTELGYINMHVNDGIIDKEYIFTQVQHADRIWATLVALLSESNNDVPRKESSLAPLRASLRRLSTAPDIMMHDADGEEDGVEAAYVAAATAATMDDLRLSLRTSRRMSITPVKPPAEDTNPELSTSDLEDAWGQLHDGPDKSYKETAFNTQEVVCSLDQYEQLFLTDDAPHGYVQFMTGMGDTEVVATPWSPMDEDYNKSRTVEYSHPINAPLAPPKARARKEQRLRRYGNHGISLETDTYVDDVPMTDCFFVTDRILISASKDGVVTISAYFDIRFVKSTMFRSIIANTTRSEFLKWFQSFVRMVRCEALALKAAPLPLSEGKENEEDSSELAKETTTPIQRRRSSIATLPLSATIGEPLSSNLTKILIGLVSLVMLLQVHMVFKMNGMQRSILAVQLQKSQMCVLPQDLKTVGECEELLADLI